MHHRDIAIHNAGFVCGSRAATVQRSTINGARIVAVALAIVGLMLAARMLGI